MLELSVALEKLLGCVPNPVEEIVPLNQAFKRVAAADIHSTIDLPEFDNSAMDGFAVRASEIRRAQPQHPVRLRLSGQNAAGDPPGRELPEGTCRRIFTGSPVPTGADAVVMQEETRVDAQGEVSFLEPVEPGANIRRCGEDIRKGDLVIRNGLRLTAGRIGLLAAIGSACVSVGRRPVVGVIATGSELLEPGIAHGVGKIFESNRSLIAALLQEMGCPARIYPIVPDALEAVKGALALAMSECDAIVSSGGVSVGERDFVREALASLGAKVEFWRIAMRPGKPFCFGRCGTRLFFGLPGNPASTFVTFVLLVRPALLKWQGATGPYLRKIVGSLAERVANNGDRRHFMRMALDEEGRIRSAGGQASHFLSALAEAEGLIDVLPHTSLEVGHPVTLNLWDQ